MFFFFFSFLLLFSGCAIYSYLIRNNNYSLFNLLLFCLFAFSFLFLHRIGFLQVVISCLFLVSIFHVGVLLEESGGS